VNLENGGLARAASYSIEPGRKFESVGRSRGLNVAAGCSEPAEIRTGGAYPWGKNPSPLAANFVTLMPGLCSDRGARCLGDVVVELLALGRRRFDAVVERLLAQRASEFQPLGISLAHRHVTTNRRGRSSRRAKSQS
jgi:hypothetical protein